MEIDNIELVYFIDYIDKRIHLLEVKQTHTKLLNTISPEFKKKLVEKEHLLIDILDFEWICYASGGLIMAYKDYNLVFIDKNEKRLHSPFKAQIEGF